MQIGILGTGMVGRALAEGFVRTGHDVAMGTRDVHETTTRPLPGTSAMMSDWLADHAQVALADLAAVAAAADVVVNATNGAGTVPALTAAGADNLAGKVLVDVANPLDFSAGFPPTLFVKDDDSLGERVQRTYPEAKVVKALNTLTAPLMVDPGSLGASSTVFVSGDDADAKATVVALLASFGHDDVIDLGPLETARGTEMLLPLWLRLMGALGTGMFNIKVVR